MVDDLDDVWNGKRFREGDGGSSFTGNDRFVIAATLARLSETVPTLSSDFINVVNRLVDRL